MSYVCRGSANLKLAQRIFKAVMKLKMAIQCFPLHRSLMSVKRNSSPQTNIFQIRNSFSRLIYFVFRKSQTGSPAPSALAQVKPFHIILHQVHFIFSRDKPLFHPRNQQIILGAFAKEKKGYINNMSKSLKCLVGGVKTKNITGFWQMSIWFIE